METDSICALQKDSVFGLLNCIFLSTHSLQGSMIPKPRFLQRRIGEVAIGTFKQIATVQESASVFDALTTFVERRVSALPVVDEQGSVMSH